MQYGTVLMFLFVAVVFAVGGIVVNLFIGPHKPGKEKNTVYECGIDPTGDARIRYSIRFYVFALMYVIFAVEAAFLIPWAVVFKTVPGIMVLIEALIFIGILILGLAYAWEKGEL